MCQNCIHARASVAGKLMLYHIDMMSVMGYTALEGALDEQVGYKYPDLSDEERNRVVTDAVAGMGSLWSEELSKEMGNLLGKYIARGARECIRSIKSPDIAYIADQKDLDKLMQARQTMDEVLQDTNVQIIVDDLTDEEDEES